MPGAEDFSSPSEIFFESSANGQHRFYSCKTSDLLGWGGYGSVWKCSVVKSNAPTDELRSRYDNNNGELFAIKQISIDKAGCSVSTLKNLRKLTSLRGTPHTVAYYAVGLNSALNPRSINFLMELCASKILSQFHCDQVKVPNKIFSVYWGTHSDHSSTDD